MIQAARGRLRKQIAHDIGIAEATVKVHRMRAVQKMMRFPEFGRLADKLKPLPEMPQRSRALRLARRAVRGGISGPAVHGLVEPVMRRGL